MLGGVWNGHSREPLGRVFRFHDPAVSRPLTGLPHDPVHSMHDPILGWDVTIYPLRNLHTINIKLCWSESPGGSLLSKRNRGSQ